ncbi:hypothetical protein [Bacillus marinisedimentorum]|uniref:hypothetical protein n=1 Tax=Bacillus marinisedimentorum TaxID=1821260 RepID=UPI0007E0EBB2|nr:hypothetical protein [Bacillus marinisedimentorum]
MKYANVIDFFSRKSYPKLAAQDYGRNDELAEKHGTYLGCLGGKDAQAIRNLTSEMGFRREQLDQLTIEWEGLFNDQRAHLLYCLDYLKVPEINLEKDSVLVDERGHVWVVYDVEKVNKGYEE